MRRVLHLCRIKTKQMAAFRRRGRDKRQKTASTVFMLSSREKLLAWLTAGVTEPGAASREPQPLRRAWTAAPLIETLSTVVKANAKGHHH